MKELTIEKTSLKLRVGDLVEVRSEAEILATLDGQGELENLPFMPEMLQFCGKRLKVHKVAHKLCDTISASGLRRMDNAVHLAATRCDGQAHGGCQTGCSLYWKEAWLKRVTDEKKSSREGESNRASPANASLATLEKCTRKPKGADGEECFSCQATELLRAAPVRIRFWNIRQYVMDFRSGNAPLSSIVRGILFGLFNAYQARSKRYLPRWLRIREGMPWGFVKGHANGATPSTQLNLSAGEFVRIRPKEEIVVTLNSKRLNRGMGFEEEMARSCGRVSRVARRVDRCIDERTGKMLTMKNSCIVLDGVLCDGVYHANCPREFEPFWREIWLERVPSQEIAHSNK